MKICFNSECPFKRGTPTQCECAELCRKFQPVKFEFNYSNATKSFPIKKNSKHWNSANFTQPNFTKM